MCFTVKIPPSSKIPNIHLLTVLKKEIIQISFGFIFRFFSTYIYISVTERQKYTSIFLL